MIRLTREEFYKKLDELFSQSTYKPPKKYVRRWGQRNPGNGRYADRGIVRWFSESCVHVYLTNPNIRKTFGSASDALTEIQKKMTTYHLITFSRDWADEFQADGFRVVTGDELEDFNRMFKEHGDLDVDFYFGTNEGWYDTVSEVKEYFEVKEITEAQYDFIKQTFGQSYGIFYDVVEVVSEYLEREEDDE